MAQLALSFRAVRKAYGAHLALDDVSMQVGAGELVGLVGMNGAGKTTLIKCLLDFARPDGGEIEIAGLRHAAPAARAPVAFLPERFVPPHYLRGEDFLRLMASLHGHRHDRERAMTQFAALDLDPRALTLPVRAFSKGMTQKLGLAACLLSGKPIQVLDEPSSGLDPRARALFKRALLDLRARGHTVLLTSHLLADVAELCDRMALLHAGKLRFLGTPAELVAARRSASLEEAFLETIAHPQQG